MDAQRQHGYIALMAILIIGAAATAIGLTLLSTGADSARVGTVEQQGKQARSLAIACGEEAMQQLHDNIAFTATNSSMSLGQGNCTYSVGVSGPTARVISASGTVGTTTRKIQAPVTINASTITAATWLDVNDRYASVAHVQSASLTNDTGTTTLVQVFTNNVASGNLIVAAASWDSTSTTTMSCTDSRGNTYSNVNVWNDTTNTQTLGICYAIGGSSGADTVTVTLGAGASFRRMVISEYSGVAATSPVDVSASAPAAAATTTTDATTSGAVTTTLDGDLIYGAVMDTTGSATTIQGTGFQPRGYTNTKDILVEDRQQTAAGSIAATFTIGTAGNRYIAAIVAFKAARQ
jgi:hypothetical protein